MFSAVISRINNLNEENWFHEMTQSKIEIEVAVLQTKMDHIEESIHEIRDQIDGIETRVMRIERVVYMLLGGLIFIQALPIVQELLS